MTPAYSVTSQSYCSHYIQYPLDGCATPALVYAGIREVFLKSPLRRALLE